MLWGLTFTKITDYSNGFILDANIDLIILLATKSTTKNSVKNINIDTSNSVVFAGCDLFSNINSWYNNITKTHNLLF